MHELLGKRIDLYSGLSINGRMSMATHTETTKPLTRFKVDGGVFAGARFYPTEHLGFYLEHGSDGVACTKAGIAFRLGAPAE